MTKSIERIFPKSTIKHQKLFAIFRCSGSVSIILFLSLLVKVQFRYQFISYFMLYIRQSEFGFKILAISSKHFDCPVFFIYKKHKKETLRIFSFFYSRKFTHSVAKEFFATNMAGKKWPHIFVALHFPAHKNVALPPPRLVRLTAASSRRGARSGGAAVLMQNFSFGKRIFQKSNVQKRHGI